MIIGIVLGIILGLILLIVGGVAFFVAKKSGKKCRWYLWVLFAGVCALITACVNALKFLM